MNWAALFKDVKYTGKLDFFKAKFRDHYCYKCRSILSITDLGRTVHIDDAESDLYVFPTEQVSRYNRAPIEECTFFRHAFLCPKCDYTIELPTQITLEKTDKYLKKLQKRLYKKHNLIIKRVFETNNEKILEIFKNIDDVKNLVLLVYKDGKQLVTYRSPVLQRDRDERAHYFSINKTEFLDIVHTAVTYETITCAIRSNISEYLDEQDIAFDQNGDILTFGFNIKGNNLEITYDVSSRIYRIKLENNSEKNIQKTLLLTMSKYYESDLKALMKDNGLSRGSFENHVLGLTLLMKKYLGRTGNLRFFEQAYFPDKKLDGIVI